MNNEPTIRLTLPERFQLLSKRINEIWYAMKYIFKWTFWLQIIIFSFLAVYNGAPALLEYFNYVKENITWTYMPEATWKWSRVGINLLAYFMISCLSYFFTIPVFFLWSFSASNKMVAARPLDDRKVLTPKEFSQEMSARKDRCRIWIVAYVGIPIHMETGHIGVCGSTGGGKSQTINLMIPYIFACQIRCIIHDCKEDYYSIWGTELDIIFCPLDRRHCGWSILSEVDALFEIDIIVESFIPERPNLKSDDYWIRTPRQVLQAILRYCFQTKQNKNTDIWRMLNLPIEVLAEELKKVPGTEAAIGHIGHAEKKDNKAPYDIISIVKSYCQCIEYMKDTDGDFKVTEWLLNGKGNLYLLNYSSIRQTMRPVLTAFANLLVQKVLALSQDHHRRISFILDELPQLNKLTSILDLLTLSRDRGAMNIVGYQNISALRSKYGPDDTENILSNLKTNLICQLGDMRTAREFSDKMGTHDEVVTLRSHVVKPANDFDGSNYSEQIRTRPLVRPEELINLKKTSRTYEVLMHILGYQPVNFHCKIKKYKPRNESLQLRQGLTLKDILEKAAEAKNNIQEIHSKYGQPVIDESAEDEVDDMDVCD